MKRIEKLAEEYMPRPIPFVDAYKIYMDGIRKGTRLSLERLKRDEDGPCSDDWILKDLIEELEQEEE